MAAIEIDAAEYEAIRLELTGRHEQPDGDTTVTTGAHEDLGRVTLRKQVGRFTVEAEEASFVRPLGTPADE